MKVSSVERPEGVKHRDDICLYDGPNCLVEPSGKTIGPRSSVVWDLSDDGPDLIFSKLVGELTEVKLRHADLRQIDVPCVCEIGA